jgi:maltose alpha-D-glucosyltransferase/alpha-amylase
MQRSFPLQTLLLTSAFVCGGVTSVAGQSATAELQRPATDYVQWLEHRSMLFQAREQARLISGDRTQWHHSYGEPQPREAIKQASVWLLDYPGSVIPRPGKSVIATWGDPDLWMALEHIGIDLLHTGPIKRAGGIRGSDHTPSVDGWFDPISIEIDPELGTDEEYREMVRTAAKHRAVIAGDLVPLHTGMGPDFRLAEFAFKDYPGLYTMVEIDAKDWQLLPAVDSPWAAALVSKEAASRLHQKGYLPGLINSNDATPKARDMSGWSATGEVVGVDGQRRRWVFLHYFKKEQPTLNWLDPSFAAQRAVSGDIVKTVHSLGARVMRLDAVPFLGIEPQAGENLSRHFKHPLSIQGTNSLAFLIRKLGGYSFHELNIPLQELKAFTEHGPDLSYDFFTRAQCVHALLVQDATMLRQSFQFLLDAEVQPVSLVHDLQNHDEITYQLTELDGRGDEMFDVNGEKVSGRQLRERMLREMRTKASGESAPHNKLYRPQRDGLATTFAGFIAAALGIADPYRASPRDVEQIKQAHLLLAAANAMQPGVFSLSSWDLVGALPIDEKTVAERMADGDYRWINRGGVDLMGANLGAEASAFGIERAVALYGSLPQQLGDSASFSERLRRMLAVRKKFQFAQGELLAVPRVRNRACCVLALRLPGHYLGAFTILNFSHHEVQEEIDLAALQKSNDDKTVTLELLDAQTEEPVQVVSAMERVTIQVPALSAKALVVRPSRE